MNSKYKIKKDHGFNPFRNQVIERLNLHRKNNETQTPIDIDCKQFAIILDEYVEKGSQTDKQGPLICQNFQLHLQEKEQIDSKRIIMFNDKEYCQKEFKQIYYSSQLNENQSSFITQALRKSSRKDKTTRLLIYLSNSAQFSQQLIIGHNQTQKHPISQSSSSLLSQIYKQMVSGKGKVEKTGIHFSAIGIKKQNELYDLLNDMYLEAEVDEIKKVPQVKMRKIGSDVVPQNLTKQVIHNEAHFNQLIEKSVWIKSHIESYQNFNQSFLIGQVYHFYEIDQNYDVLNETVVIKINQSLVMNRTFQDGFYERRMKEENVSRVSSILMRMGMKIKNCMKNSKTICLDGSNSSRFSERGMNQSNIIMYLSPLFNNFQTKYILINEIDLNLTLNEMARKLELNKNFTQQITKQKSSKRQFLYLKHYQDNKQVFYTVKKLAVQYKHEPQSINNEKRNSMFGRFTYQRSQSIPKNSGLSQQLDITDLTKNILFSAKKVWQKSARSKSHLKDASKINSKSFFSQTINSAERNYLKHVERQNRKHSKLIDGPQQASKTYYSKAINQRMQAFKFVQDNYLSFNKSRGRGHSYKRKMVVKKEQLFPEYLPLQSFRRQDEV